MKGKRREIMEKKMRSLAVRLRGLEIHLEIVQATIVGLAEMIRATKRRD
jgi:hypothetical protein